MKTLTLLAALAAGLVSVCGAQTFKEVFSKHWKTSGEFTLAVADGMPAEHYAFKPNPEEMSFGVLMAHIAMANNNAFAMVSETKAPVVPEQIVAAYKKKGDVTKEQAMRFLKESFDYCTRTLEQITEDQLKTPKGPEGRQMTGAERLWAYFTHTAHHRGQAEVYMRVKDLKPPSYRF